jgi:uncharacterized protein (DUF2336 family)
MTTTMYSCDEIIAALEATSWVARAKAGERLARLYSTGKLRGGERRAAEEAFHRLLSYEYEVNVRRVVLDALGDAGKLLQAIEQALGDAALN